MRLQQILIGRELGLSLEDVRRALDEPGFDRRAALLAQRAALAARAERAGDMIRAIDLSAVPPPVRAFAERFLHLTRDEPWQFGFPFRGERKFLEELGFGVGEILTIGSDDATRRYLTRADGTRVGAAIPVRMPTPDTPAAREQAEAMAYKIAEAFVPLRH